MSASSSKIIIKLGKNLKDKSEDDVDWYADMDVDPYEEDMDVDTDEDLLDLNLDRDQKPEWLERFLKRTFFDSCKCNANSERRSDANRFCITCELSACQYCMSTSAHRHHKILKIYRHVYKDVVTLASIQKHVDCTQIQPYKSNKRLVVALNPLPHSGLSINTNASCKICRRRLVEPHHFSFCSIACKLEAFLIKARSSDRPFLHVLSSPAKERPKRAVEPEKPKRHRRKGIPVRAPFF